MAQVPTKSTGVKDKEKDVEEKEGIRKIICTFSRIRLFILKFYMILQMIITINLV